jgi:phosphate:Na+ symporter
MKGTFALLDVAGYVALLLWGTHMVTSGVLRGYGSALRRSLGHFLGTRPRAFAFGLCITALLQSSTATGMMATSFAANGFLGLAPGLAVMLGANVGTTLIVQVMSFDIALIAPVLILLGTALHRRSDDARCENLGRVGIGRGLMLLALHLLVLTMAPMENGHLLKVGLRALADEPLFARFDNCSDKIADTPRNAGYSAVMMYVGKPDRYCWKRPFDSKRSRNGDLWNSSPSFSTMPPPM